MRMNATPGQRPANVDFSGYRPQSTTPVTPAAQPAPGTVRGQMPDPFQAPEYKPAHSYMAGEHPMDSQYATRQSYKPPEVPDNPYRRLPEWLTPANMLNTPEQPGMGDWRKQQVAQSIEAAGGTPHGAIAAAPPMMQMPVLPPGTQLPTYRYRPGMTMQPTTATLSPQQMTAMALLRGY